MKPRMKKLPLALVHALGAGVALSMVAVPAALAQQATAPQKIDKIEVTGSNIKRIEGESALPVQVLTREDIQKTGAATVEQLLQSVAVAVQGNSNTVAASASGAITGGVSSVSLRGLGSQRTLVLVNGRRIAGGGTITDSTTVDVNSIPLAAIERVEVLKDGASAVYGSDAIAGVINFIMRRDYQGVEVTAYYGDTNDGGGSVTRAVGTVGFGDLGRDRYNVMLTASYQKEKPLFGRDRAFASSSVNKSANNDTTSGNTFPANVAIPTPFGTTPALRGVATTAINPFAGNCAPSITDPFFSPNVCRYDTAKEATLLPDTDRTSVYGAAHFAITQDVEAYTELSYNRNKQQVVNQAVPISDQFTLPPNNALAKLAPYNTGTALTGVPDTLGWSTIVLKSTSPYYPTAAVQSVTGGITPDVLVRWRAIAAGNRDFTDTAEQPRVVVGVKGTAAGWGFDAAYLFSQSKLTEHVNGGYPLSSQILPLLNSGTVNFFGPNTPAVQAQIDATGFVGDSYETKTTTQSIAAKASKEIMQLPAGALALAFGAEYRKEKFEIDPSLQLQQGDISGYGNNFFPVDVSRNVTGIFAELSAPIVKTLEGNIAVRYDDYEGTGSKTTPKVGLRWQPTKEFLARASYGKGSRAPSLTELHAPQTIGVTAPGNDPARCDTTGDSDDCATQFPILAGGNTQLKPETSDNYTLGVLFEPTNRISLGLDAFRIKLRDTIIFGIDPNFILDHESQFPGFVSRGAPTANCPGCPGPVNLINQINQNQGKTKVSGVDVDFRWRLPAGEAGNFTVALNGTYFSQYDVQLPDGSFIGVAGKVSPIVNGAGGAIPRWHHYLSADWVQGPWGLTVAQNFQNGYEDLPGTAEDPTDPAFKPRHVGTYETYDVQGRYTGVKHLVFALGIKNVFNRDPPYTNAGGQNFFQTGYDPGYADPRGRFFYGRLTYVLK